MYELSDKDILQKKFTKAFICTTAVLATIGLMLISAVYSGDTSNSEIPLVKSGAVIKETTKSEIIIESTEQPKMTTEKIITQDTKPEITRQEEPTESKEPVEIHTTTEASPNNDVLYIPENLQDSERYQKMESAIDNLESAIDSIDEAKESIDAASE